MTKTYVPTEPFWIHIVGRRRGLTVHDPVGRSRILTHGQQALITPEAVELMSDSRGRCTITDLLHDPEGQRRVFGEHLFSPGPWPESASRLVPGTHAHADAREVARQRAHAELDPEARRAALAAVNEEFGPAPTTSRTLRSHS